MDDQRAAQQVVRAEGSFGVIWQLWDGNMLMDTYCPWNGDERPDWMPDSQSASEAADVIRDTGA